MFDIWPPSEATPEGLRVRAAIWRDNEYHDPENRTQQALYDAAEEIARAQAALAAIAALPPRSTRSDVETLAAARPALPPSFLRRIAWHLRASDYPNDSGSTATHLDSAADRIERQTALFERVDAALRGHVLDLPRIRAIARSVPPQTPAPTHPAPAMRQ